MTEATSTAPWQRANTDWFRNAKWGVFTHYLVPATMSAEDWNRQVESFDVDRLAQQLASTGAPYCCLTEPPLSPALRWGGCNRSAAEMDGTQ